MNAKERFYSGLAKETIGKITSNTDNWTSFLRTMSRNYEFTYPEQVMIYAQRPNATFCKPYEDWNAENYRRYVKRGSTGIALFVMNRDKPYLRYVFDVADTGVRRSSPELKPWEVTPENRSYVMEAMERTFGVAADGVLEAQLEDIASALAAEYWDDYKKQFLDIVANSFLEEYDELNIEVAFKNAVANSVSYTMYCRFVESPDNYFEHEDFQKVFDFNTRQTVNALGTAVNAISTRMFQEIEKAIGEHEQIKATERSTDYERDDLQTGRRLSDSEPSVGERGRETSGQVRQDASSIFGTEQSDAPERHDSDGEPVPAPVGDRGNSESQSGVSDGAVPEGQPRTGQGNAADGVGAAHEQPESAGGGNDPDRADLQLSFLEAAIPTEAQQIESIDQAENEKSSSAFVLSQADIEKALRRGSNFENSKLRIWEIYQTQPDRKLRAKALAKEYAPHGPGGCSHTYLDGSSGWLDHDSKGLTFEHYPDNQKIFLRWNQVEKYIDLMMQADRYLTDKEKSAIELYFGLNADSAAEYNALKEQYPDALVGFEKNGQFEFYGEDARKICELTGGKLLERETALGTVLVTGFPREQWVYRAKQLWECGENIYLAGLNEDGTHHQTKYLRREDYLPVGSIVHMEGREFRVDKVDFDKDSVTLQDMALAELRMPIFREAPLAVVRELYEQEPEPPFLVSDGLGLPGEDSDKSPVSIEANEVPTTPEAAAAEEGLNEEGAPEPAGNFRITDEELGAGGPKQKFARNIKAIKTLFTLEQEHRGATAEEQQVLSQYVGWGGLADAFDPDKSSWAKEYAELKGLLSEEEYKAARGSVLNAHYTSPTVIRAIYDAVERMGFRTGNILEPSMGVGNFFGMLPESMTDSRLYGVELDSITGRIAQKLYPEANIKVAGFETTDRRDFYDLAVGNVPFGNYKVNDKAYNKLNFSIHNTFRGYCIEIAAQPQLLD